MQFHAYAAAERDGTLLPFPYEPAPLGVHDVEIAITHCGICHSDLHLWSDHWGFGRFPLVPGHEIVGHAVARGAEVQGLAHGQRVGLGWQRGACLRCEWCLGGQENLCPEQQATCVGHFGGFADRIRADARFVFPIPDALPSDAAAPLLCAGATVYAALRRHGARPDWRVGVIGVGGLGHLALQFARAFGCHVTAITSALGKEAAARMCGAHDVVVAPGGGALAATRDRFDFVLSTVHADLDWPVVVESLRPNGTLCFVGAPSTPLALPAGLLLAGQKRVTGSLIAGRGVLREMLEVAARTGVRAQIETLAMRDVNRGLQRLAIGQVRFRVVLANG